MKQSLKHHDINVNQWIFNNIALKIAPKSKFKDKHVSDFPH